MGKNAHYRQRKNSLSHYKYVFNGFVCVSHSVMSNSLRPHQAPLSIKFSRQEYWRRQPFHSSGNLLDPGIKPRSPAWQADSSLSKPPGKTSITFSEIFRKLIQALLLLLSHSVKSYIFVTPWTPLSMGFSRQEYWNGLPFPPPGGYVQLRYRTQVSCKSLALKADSLPLSHMGRHIQDCPLPISTISNLPIPSY